MASGGGEEEEEAGEGVFFERAIRSVRDAAANSVTGGSVIGKQTQNPAVVTRCVTLWTRQTKRGGGKQRETVCVG